MRQGTRMQSREPTEIAAMTDPTPEPRARQEQSAERRGLWPLAVPEATPRAERPSRDEGNVALEELSAYYGSNQALNDVSLAFPSGRVTAIIGPSGCGKSTLVRCINRMHEEVPGARAERKVTLDGVDLYDPRIDIVAVRRSIGM